MRTPQLSGLPEATAARARRRAVKQHFRSARKLGDRGRVLGLLSCLGGVFTTPRVARTGISDIQRCGHWLLQGRMGITEPCSKRFVHYSDVGELSEFGLVPRPTTRRDGFRQQKSCRTWLARHHNCRHLDLGLTGLHNCEKCLLFKPLRRFVIVSSS
uniref:uncharacterized protein LOC118538564 isoform X1 n=1 Tax=Halichoerus grypus TaxID=9711 RepID=UPI00165980E6|nr:uncharacterized protein LOC118538564 isoform X1 [Halichoerus grypus]